MRPIAIYIHWLTTVDTVICVNVDNNITAVLCRDGGGSGLCVYLCVYFSVCMCVNPYTYYKNTIFS